MVLLLVFVGGCAGAALRYATDRLVQARHTKAIPLGTFCVNMCGSTVLGVFAGASAQTSPYLTALIATGFCGALTTFSAFSYETVRLLGDRLSRTAALHVLLHVVVGLSLMTLGYQAAVALAGH